jgi:hypothetical protein
VVATAAATWTWWRPQQRAANTAVARHVGASDVPRGGGGAARDAAVEGEAGTHSRSDAAASDAAAP